MALPCRAELLLLALSLWFYHATAENDRFDHRTTSLPSSTSIDALEDTMSPFPTDSTPNVPTFLETDKTPEPCNKTSSKAPAQVTTVHRKPRYWWDIMTTGTPEPEGLYAEDTVLTSTPDIDQEVSTGTGSSTIFDIAEETDTDVPLTTYETSDYPEARDSDYETTTTRKSNYVRPPVKMPMKSSYKKTTMITEDQNVLEDHSIQTTAVLTEEDQHITTDLNTDMPSTPVDEEDHSSTLETSSTSLEDLEKSTNDPSTTLEAFTPAGRYYQRMTTTPKVYVKNPNPVKYPGKMYRTTMNLEEDDQEEVVSLSTVEVTQEDVATTETELNTIVSVTTMAMEHGSSASTSFPTSLEEIEESTNGPSTVKTIGPAERYYKPMTTTTMKPDYYGKAAKYVKYESMVDSEELLEDEDSTQRTSSVTGQDIATMDTELYTEVSATVELEDISSSRVTGFSTTLEDLDEDASVPSSTMGTIHPEGRYYQHMTTTIKSVYGPATKPVKYVKMYKTTMNLVEDDLEDVSTRRTSVFTSEELETDKTELNTESSVTPVEADELSPEVTTGTSTEAVELEELASVPSSTMDAIHPAGRYYKPMTTTTVKPYGKAAAHEYYRSTVVPEEDDLEEYSTLRTSSVTIEDFATMDTDLNTDISATMELEEYSSSRVTGFSTTLEGVDKDASVHSSTMETVHPAGRYYKPMTTTTMKSYGKVAKDNNEYRSTMVPEEDVLEEDATLRASSVAIEDFVTMETDLNAYASVTAEAEVASFSSRVIDFSTTLENLNEDGSVHSSTMDAIHPAGRYYKPMTTTTTVKPYGKAAKDNNEYRSTVVVEDDVLEEDSTQKTTASTLEDIQVVETELNTEVSITVEDEDHSSSSGTTSYSTTLEDLHEDTIVPSSTVETTHPVRRYYRPMTTTTTAKPYGKAAVYIEKHGSTMVPEDEDSEEDATQKTTGVTLEDIETMETEVNTEVSMSTDEDESSTSSHSTVTSTDLEEIQESSSVHPSTMEGASPAGRLYEPMRTTTNRAYFISRKPVKYSRKAYKTTMYPQEEDALDDRTTRSTPGSTVDLETLGTDFSTGNSITTEEQETESATATSGSTTLVELDESTRVPSSTMDTPLSPARQFEPMVATTKVYVKTKPVRSTERMYRTTMDLEEDDVPKDVSTTTDMTTDGLHTQETDKPTGVSTTEEFSSVTSTVAGYTLIPEEFGYTLNHEDGLGSTSKTKPRGRDSYETTTPPVQYYGRMYKTTTTPVPYYGRKAEELTTGASETPMDLESLGTETVQSTVSVKDELPETATPTGRTSEEPSQPEGRLWFGSTTSSKPPVRYTGKMSRTSVSPDYKSGDIPTNETTKAFPLSNATGYSTTEAGDPTGTGSTNMVYRQRKFYQSTVTPEFQTDEGVSGTFQIESTTELLGREVHYARSAEDEEEVTTDVADASENPEDTEDATEDTTTSEPGDGERVHEDEATQDYGYGRGSYDQVKTTTRKPETYARYAYKTTTTKVPDYYAREAVYKTETQVPTGETGPYGTGSTRDTPPTSHYNLKRRPQRIPSYHYGYERSTGGHATYYGRSAKQTNYETESTEETSEYSEHSGSTNELAGSSTEPGVLSTEYPSNYGYY